MAPRKRSSVPRAITADEFASLMAGLNPRYKSNLRMRAMLSLMYLGGLRCGEVCALEAGAVNRSERVVEVPYVAGLTKTGGRRVGLIPSETLDAALEAWESVRDTSSPYYFHTNEGGRVDTSQVRRRLAQVAARAGLSGVHPHSLRHSYARNLVSAGVAINVVQSALGHADLSTTTRYTRLSEHEQITALRGVIAPL